jgi:hypothetical protein
MGRKKPKHTNSDILDGTKTPTKRKLLRVSMSLFDPIGYLSPITISSRILLKTVWKNEIGWDDELKTNLYENWKSWPPPGLFSSQDEMFRKQWRTVQHWKNEFWGRWLKEYLPTLQKTISKLVIS